MGIIEDKYDSHQQLVEKNVLQSINHISDAYTIAENQLNKEMQEYSLVMQEKYREEPDVMNWDLEEMKKEFGDYEIYIIDSDLKIIRTTYEDDLGLDFSVYSGFSQVLRERLESDSFSVDRLDISTTGGDIKKYSYMPTPDKKYLLELSIKVQEKYPSLEGLNIFADATELTEDYDIVEEISFFSVEPVNKGVAKLTGDREPYLDPDINEFERSLARNTVLTGEMQTKELKQNGYNYTKKFFPALISGDNNQTGWNSYVIGITYNDKPVQEEKGENRNLFLLNGLIMTVVFILFIISVILLLKKYEHMAYHDQLTNLPNRKYLYEEIKRKINCANNNHKKVGILFLDIDKFKEINDKYGHDTGDQVLIEFTERVNKSVKDGDLFVRLGGDEFVMALTVDNREKIINRAKKIIERFKEPMIVKNNKLKLNISIGIALYPENGSNINELITKADRAMYKAKKAEQKYVIYQD